MATYRKRGSAWRAEVAKNGVRRSATFDLKAQAVEWATRIEAEILAGKLGTVKATKTLADAIDRYKTEVTPSKRGSRWETIRLDKFKRDLTFVGELIEQIAAEHIGGWRDLRLNAVAPSSVNREMNLLSAVFETARREWRWCATNPVREVRRPKNPKARDRRITDAEINVMLEKLGYQRGTTPTNVSMKVAVAFLFALETAMRAGEIVNLQWNRVFLDKKYVRLVDTKNEDSRDVPLSSVALKLLLLLPKEKDDEANSSCFGITGASLDALFRKARLNAIEKEPSVADLHFHDSRHEAITRLARKLDVLDLARMIGHRDLKSLMIYYNATATDIASRLE